MSEDIPFRRRLDLAPDTVDEPSPGIRRVMANNPGPFTFKGTLSYIVGRGNVAIVDPGPEDAAHTQALLDAVKGEKVTHIFVTHTHRDHSPGVAALKAQTGATVYAEGPHRASRPLHIGEHNPLDSSGDRDFRPDVQLKDGDVVDGGGWSIESVTTPGHTANHMAFALRGKNILFAGDHVMGWSTSIVAPPDGAMSDYMASLEKLRHRDEDLYFPGHGPAIPQAKRFVGYYILHRRAREASILHRLGKGASDIPSLVRALYVGIDPRLTGAAGLSVLAHLEDLVARDAVETDGAPAIDGVYRLKA
jgi:glyoxylase-like metal-dependent hydrolase (beta-lactamase superfamily II)